jgi:two-component system cell cycle sensor histidine kinase/response regulator CckA
MAERTKPAILLVEDEDAVRRVISRMLSGRGYTVFESHRADDGLQVFLAHAQAIDLAIIDMVMPGMSGLDLASELSRLRPDIKVLYISGYSESIAMDVIAHRSPELVLLKPFTATDLMSRIQDLLAEARRGGSADTPARA